MVRDFFSKLLRREISSFVRISVTVAPRYPVVAGISRCLLIDFKLAKDRDHEIRPAMWPE
jgi:hypothetical protein